MPYVSNIQRFSLDDGPGIRTTVFFKGCNLRCAWCHNPECIEAAFSLQFEEASCTACGKCAEVCTNGVHRIDEAGKHRIDRSKCIGCGACAYSCPNTALSLIGRRYTPEELLAQVMKDHKYYETSKGGVTFSGGEPMLYPSYLSDVLRLCKAEGLHTAVDTAGCVDFSGFEQVMPWADLFLYDIKLLNGEKHKNATGVPNERILENLDRLTRAEADVYIRTPVIPTYNDELDELSNIAAFLAKLPGREHVRLIQLLPYHNYGVGKYEALGKASRTTDIKSPSEEFMKAALEQYKKLGLPARVS